MNRTHVRFGAARARAIAVLSVAVAGCSGNTVPDALRGGAGSVGELEIDGVHSGARLEPGAFVQIDEHGELEEVSSPCGDLLPSSMRRVTADNRDNAPTSWQELIGDAAFDADALAARPGSSERLLGDDFVYAGLYGNDVRFRGSGSFGVGRVNVTGSGSRASFQAWRIRRASEVDASSLNTAISDCCVLNGCGDAYVRSGTEYDVYAYLYADRELDVSGSYMTVRAAADGAGRQGSTVSSRHYVYQLVAVPERADAVVDVCPIPDYTVSNAGYATVAFHCPIENLNISVTGAAFDPSRGAQPGDHIVALRELDPQRPVTMHLTSPGLEPHTVSITQSSGGVAGAQPGPPPASAAAPAPPPASAPTGAGAPIEGADCIDVPGAPACMPIASTPSLPFYRYVGSATDAVGGAVSAYRRPAGPIAPPCVPLWNTGLCVPADRLPIRSVAGASRQCMPVPGTSFCVEPTDVLNLLVSVASDMGLALPALQDLMSPDFPLFDPGNLPLDPTMFGIDPMQLLPF